MIDGDRMWACGISAHGKITQEGALSLLRNIIAALKMHPCYEPIIHKFPCEGKGGVGWTIYQTLTESFAILDYWPNIGALYIHVVSCKSFAQVDVKEVLEDAGLDPIDIRVMDLRGFQ